MDVISQIKRLAGTIILSIGMVTVVTNVLAAVQTVKTGIASPQSDSEIGNIEVLRQRAIRNAMDLALLEVKGTIVSSEQTDTMRASDKVSIKGGVDSQEVEQETLYRDASLTRTEGHVRLLKILEEWKEADRYHVKVKLEVLEQPEATKKMGAGFFWERVGKPGISLTLRDTLNNSDIDTADGYTLRFIRDVLTKNGLQTTPIVTTDSRYQTEIIQQVDVSVVKSYGTYAAHCNLSYRIFDGELGRNLVENRSSHGPQAGFSLESAKRDCLKAIAPALSEKLVRSLAGIFNDQWNQGDEYVVRIAGLPGVFISDAVDALEQAFRMRDGRMDEYVDGKLVMTVRYHGKSTELTRAVVSAFDDIGHQIVPERVDSNAIGFRWLNSSN